MWFKRRKKTEQDHLLSESLRSLQTLLSESSDRLEPSLDHRHTQDDMDSTEKTDKARGNPPSVGDDAKRDDTPGSESGNRWRDLSLNFDAEPATPRLRRSGQPNRETEGGTKEPPSQPRALARNESRVSPKPPPEPEPSDLEKTVVDETSTEHVDIEMKIQAAPASTPSEPAPGPPMEDEEEMELDIEAVPVLEPVEPAPEAALEDDREPAIQYFDRIPSAARTPTGGEDDTSTLEIELPEVRHDPTVNSLNEPGGHDKTNSSPDEDQLHLELETAEDDIPTLTDAVYIPDAEISEAEPDQGEFAAPESFESPYEEDIEQCLENLRVRLQLMGLDLLSTEQENELRDTLVEFMDERGFSTSKDG